MKVRDEGGGALRVEGGGWRRGTKEYWAEEGELRVEGRSNKD